jgi:hypothetical protein
LSSIKIIAPNGSEFYTSYTEGELTSSDLPGMSYKPRIGAPMTLIPTDDWPRNDARHIMVVGVFSDGVDQIVLDIYL